jgi:hypothetical protein
MRTRPARFVVLLALVVVGGCAANKAFRAGEGAMAGI